MLASVQALQGDNAPPQVTAIADVRFRALLAGEVEAALRELNELSKNGKDLGRLKVRGFDEVVA